MEKNANDKLIWVDLFDNEIGSGGKMETHVKNKLHRAFSVYIIHEGKMLIQKRAFGKYHSAGLWANACCSHPRYGETLTEAVQKRMKEELGIPQGSCFPEELFSFNYFSQYEGLSEYEIDHVFLVDYDGPINVDPDEIAETRWVSLEDLKNEMEEFPKRFSTWFLIATPRVLEQVRNNH
jgi:isopentenyl-diphosphate delta-isomerase